MTTLIRHATFETNSSSCHSLSVSEGVTLTDTLHSNQEDGSLELQGMDFGWGQETFTDATSKLTYVLIYIRDWVCDEGDKERFTEILNHVVRNQSLVDRVYLAEGKKDQWGYSNDGYIDHQSVEDRDLDFFFEDPEQLRRFIFNPNSVLETDNDNH